MGSGLTVPGPSENMTTKRAKSRKKRPPEQALLLCLRQAQRLDSIAVPLSRRGDEERCVEWFRLPDGGVRLARDSVDAFYELVDTLEDDRRIGYEFSAKTIQKKVKDLLLSAVLGETDFDRAEVDAQTAWRALLGTFERGFRQASYFVPIANLELSGLDEVVVGAAKIHANTPSMKDKISASMAQIIRGNPRYTEEEQERQLAFVLEHIDLPTGRCTAEVSLRVHPDRGFELAAAAARESVAILRLVALLSERWGPPAVPSLLGDVIQAHRVQFRLAEGQEFGIQGDMVGIGPVQPLCLTRKAVKDLQPQLKALGAAVERRVHERRDMQYRISTALRWWSDAIVEPEASSRFLKFCVALEALLIDRETDAIATKLAQSVAVLLADNTEARLSYDALTREIYDTRSRIAHEGKDARVRRLMAAVHRIAAASILSVAGLAYEKQFTSADDLTKWVKGQLYG
jgi:hypothetical protein